MIFRAGDAELAKVLKPFKRNPDFDLLTTYLGHRYMHVVTGLVASHDENGCKRAYMAGEANALRELLAAISTLMNEPS